MTAKTEGKAVFEKMKKFCVKALAATGNVTIEIKPGEEQRGRVLLSIHEGQEKVLRILSRDEFETAMALDLLGANRCVEQQKHILMVYPVKINKVQEWFQQMEEVYG